MQPDQAVPEHLHRAARIQSLDNGEPVSLYTVRRELGWESMAMIDRIYGHLGGVRPRTEGAEYLPLVPEGAETP